MNKSLRYHDSLYTQIAFYKIMEYCEPSNCIEREQYYLDRVIYKNDTVEFFIKNPTC